MAELASGKKHIPIAKVTKNTDKYIASHYLPPDFVFKDPHNMKHKDIKKFFFHLKEREIKYSPKDVFQFTVYEDEKQGCIPMR